MPSYLSRLAASVLALLMSCAAYAQGDPTWPIKPIHFVVGFTPGGPSDILARVLAQQMSQALKQTIVVENRPGAGGNLAATQVAHSPADGYTWLLGNNSILSTNAALYKKPGFDADRDFDAVGLVGIQPSILVVSPDLPVQSVSELIAYARANPGKLNFASSGVGAAAHLTGQLFKTEAGLVMEHVPYKGAKPALTDVMSGRVQLMFATSASVMPLVQTKKLRALAVTGEQRIVELPDLPTMVESGLPGFVVVSWHGIVLPAGTPPAITQRVNQALNAALDNSETAAQFQTLGVQISTGTPKTFAAFIRSETPKWTQLVKSSGAQAN